MNTPNPFAETTALPLVPGRGSAHPADDFTRDNANPYHLLDWTLREFVRDVGDPPNHDNNVPPEVQALHDPATYEYEYEIEGVQS